MKIACQSCGAKYTIADEKVSGKTVKIKCKKCGATVVVDGHAQADGGPGYGGGEAGGDEWTVSVADDDQRTLTTEQIVVEYRNGVVGPDTFVWREGMAEWSALGEVAELASACGGQAQPAETAPQVAMGAAQQGGYGMAAAAAAPAAAAARKRPQQSVDLFGGGGGGGMEAAPAGAAGSAHIGERNENSVLFSLSALTAAESAAKKGGGGSAPKPRAPGAPAAKAVAASLDDIMNLGSGGISPGAALAPPPVNAPFIEPPPPPPPPSMSPAMMAGPASGYGQPMQGMQGGMGMQAGYPMMDQPKKSPIGLIVGGVVGLVVILGAVFMLTRGGDDKDKVATNDTAKTAEAKPDKPEKKEEPIAEAPKPEETTAPADTGAPASSAAAAPTTASTGAAPTPPAGGPLPPSTGKKEDPKKEDPKKEAPKEEPKKEEPAAGGGTGSFDRGAAQAALGSAAGGAKGCKKDGGPTGSTKVQVTFAPSGRVTTVNVGPPFAGTPVGSCIAGAFKGASVPPFSGSPVTVSKSVSIK